MIRTNRRWLAAGVVGLALTAVSILALPSNARAGLDADIRAGVYTDANAVAVGAGVLAPVGKNSRWYFNPNVEVAKGDNQNVVAMSGDFHYDLAGDRNTSMWVGAGPAVVVRDREFASTRTDLGVNLLTGVGAKRGEVRPFAQLRGTMSEQNELAIAGGIRF